MKLNKLTIKNIASIAEATIDFDAKPLADADIFLISGDTGAGKTTILDSICLALYGKTPRMVSNRMEGASEDVKEGSAVKADDPRQLMRRDTGEAFARLIFTALDGSRWQAEWSVARARRKPDGAIQNAKRVLTDLASKKTFDKVKEVSALISGLVGLEFDQFCRTSMLAQGEFTKFLNSDDKEKAAILQKVTGASEYSRIGAKIAEITSEKKHLYDSAVAKLDGIKILSEEARNALLSEHSENINLQKEAKQKQTDAEIKLKWLESAKSNLNALATYKEELKKLLALFKSEEMKEGKKKVVLWDKTTDLRHLRSNLRAYESQLALNRKALDEAAGLFGTLLTERFSLELARKRLNERADDTARKIADMSPLKCLIEDSGKWVQMMADVSDLQKKISADKKQLAGITLNLESSLRKAMTLAIAKRKEAAAAVDSAIKERHELLKKYDEKEHKGALSRKEGIIKDISTLQIRLHDIRILKELRGAYEERSASLKGIKLTLEEERRRVPELRKNAEILNSRLEEARHSYDLSSRSADDYARALRAQLKKGDRCPVCNSEICGHIDDSPFSELVRAFEAKYSKAKAEYDKAAADLSKLESQISLHTKAVDDEEKKLEKDYRNLEDKMHRLFQDIAALGIKTHKSESAKASLSSIETEVAALLSEKVEEGKKSDLKIAAAEQLKKEIDKTSKKIECLKDAQLKSETSASAAIKEVTDSETKISHISATIEESAKNADAKGKLISEELKVLNLEFEWFGHCDEVTAILNAKKQEYNNLNELRQTLERLSILYSSTLHTIDECVTGIHTLMPEWSGEVRQADGGPASEPDEMQLNAIARRATALQTEVAALASSRKDLTQSIETARRQAATLREKTGNISEATLRTIENLTAEEIASLKASLDEAKKRLAEMQGRGTILWKQAEELASSRPNIQETESELSLLRAKESASENLKTLSERQGSIAQMLADDAAQRAALKVLISKRDECYEVYSKWFELKELFGDATGSKLNKIALSYVLADLVEHANPYMRMLTDRYSLVCSPGSYLIFIEDRYDGYRRRPASTISGGESFIVSLALALALGDMGQGISADTIFIDEGFGSLSGEPLRKAINTLRSLQSRMGKHVGIISHIHELRERIPVKILVERQSEQSQSSVTVTS